MNVERVESSTSYVEARVFQSVVQCDISLHRYSENIVSYDGQEWFSKNRKFFAAKFKEECSTRPIDFKLSSRRDAASNYPRGIALIPSSSKLEE